MFGFDQEQHLIRKALNGSASAWRSIVQRHERRVYNLAYRLTGNRQDAMDLMQEAFLAVFRNLPNFRFEGSFEGWIIRIVSHRGVDFLRRRRSNPLHQADDADELLAGDSSAGEAAEQWQLHRQLRETMQKLSADQRIVIELKFFQQMTFDEIATHLNVSENTAKARLYTALTKMRGAEELQHAL